MSWAHIRCICFVLGVAARLLAVSVLTRVGQLCNIQWTAIALIDLRARIRVGTRF